MSTQRNGPKIVIVGGGSYTWCPTILGDLVRTRELEGSRVVLLDINRQAAREVATAARAMASALGRSVQFTATTSEANAFRGADFVLITISTGGLDLMEHDLKIPEQYGIFQTVGDTIGPGGWSRTLRNVPVFVHLAQQIEKFAPNAVVLNYTNPMATLTGTLFRCSGLRTVGLCHGAFETYRVLQKLFDVEENSLAVRFGGINHFFWILDFTVQGKDGYAMLKKKLRVKTIDQALPDGLTDQMGFHSHHVLVDEFYRQFGYLGYVGDRHTCEFIPGFVAPEEKRLQRFKLARTSVQDRRNMLSDARRRTLELGASKRKPPKRSRETAVDIIKTFITGTPLIEVVNLPNTGQIDNLPREAVVETLGMVDSLGFRAFATGPLPPVLHQLVSTPCQVQLMTLDASLRGDRELAFQALLLDPLCAHLAPEDVREMGRQLMEATHDRLPQFH